MDTQDKRIDDLLFGYFMDQLSEIEEKELLNWLEADDANKRYFSEMTDWWATAHVPLFKSDMQSNYEKHFGDLADKSASLAERRHFNWRLLGKVAASVLLAVAISSASYYAGRSDQKPPQDRMAWFETVTPAGSQSKVVLPDGSVVWVNAGSSLKYNMEFNKHNRDVSLIGEAYFEVVKDSLRPFIVKSGKLDIKVMGTSFNVKAYENEETIDVALVSGKVNVHLADKAPGTGDVVLAPNRMMSYNKETSRVKMSEVKGAGVYAWTNGWLEFDEQPFNRIARDLERKFNVQIRINSKSLGNEIFSGTFSSVHTLNDILREVDVEKKYSWYQKGNEFIINDK